MTELEKDLRHYLCVALTPLFDIVKVAQKDRDNLFDAIVKGDLILIQERVNNEVRQVLDRLEKSFSYQIIKSNQDIRKAFEVERKLYE